MRDISVSCFSSGSISGRKRYTYFLMHLFARSLDARQNEKEAERPSGSLCQNRNADTKGVAFEFLMVKERLVLVQDYWFESAASKRREEEEEERKKSEEGGKRGASSYSFSGTSSFVTKMGAVRGAFLRSFRRLNRST